MITGALIALAGVVVGRLTRLRRTPAQAPATLALDGAAQCGCTHHLSMHDTKTGHCHGYMKNPAFSKNYYVSKSNPKEVQCTCRQFVGTDPSAAIVAAWQKPELGE